MKTRCFAGPGMLALGVICFALSAGGGPLQTVSAGDPAQAPATGGGASVAPVMSADGRFVLFASTANNLVLSSNNAPIPSLVPARLNVYLRDRTNGTTTLVSVNLAGTGGGNGDSIPCEISTNGQFALFESGASDLVFRDTNNTTDIFVRDLVNGTTWLVSAATNGWSGNGASRSSVMTPDGRYVGFVSAANNLVSGDTNRIPDVFVRDLQTGVTTLASAGAMSTNFNAAAGSSESPDLTPDGRYVAFYSTATNLAPGVRSVGDVYVRDLVSSTTVWASAAARATLQSVLRATNGACFNHALSADGRCVAFEAGPLPGGGFTNIRPGIILRYNLDSGLTDLVHTNAAVPPTAYPDIHNLAITPDGRFVAFIANTNGTQNATTCVLVWNAANGMAALASAGLDGSVPANSVCDWPTLDATGRRVAFLSSATNLVTNLLAGDYHLYVRDLQAGTTTLVDADTNGVGTPIDPGSGPRLSADGHFVAFDCGDGSLVPNDRNHDPDIFVRDLAGGGVELISVRHESLATATPNGPSLVSPLSASRDGRFIAFASDADNLVVGDTNGYRDVFVRDLAGGTNQLVSVNSAGLPGNGPSTSPSLSADGRYVTFVSGATNLVAGDANRSLDVFWRDLRAGTTLLVSTNRTGTGSGNADSYAPVLNSDGRRVLFRSKSMNLAPGSFSPVENLFLRDMVSATTYALTTSGVYTAAMTPDGHFVTFIDMAGTMSNKLYVWDSWSASVVYTNSAFTLSSLAISPDGKRLAFGGGSGVASVFVADWAAGTNWVVATTAFPVRSGLHFSADGRFLTYTAIVSGSNQVYLCDVEARTSRLASHAYNSPTAGAGSSDSPDLSANGRFVVFRSAATNIVVGDTNGQPDIFLYDQLTDANTLLSASRSGNGAADNRSMSPFFSGDGQTLLFQTWASDIAGQDFNHSGDVLSYSLLWAMILPSAGPGQGPWITWPFVPGNNYRVQFKDSLGDAGWQDVPSPFTNAGTRAYLQDPGPVPAGRFYRIQAF